VSIAAGIFGVLTLGAWALRARTQHSDHRAARTIPTYAPEPVPSLVASVALVTSAKPPSSPSQTASVGAAPAASIVPSPPRRFDSGTARAALDAQVAATLANCKIPRGRTGRLRLTFLPNGTVSSATPLSPYAGTREGACVAAHFKKVHIPPFAGQAADYVYTFGTRR
jgi:hypothetical protein